MSILATSKINQLLQLGHKGGLYFAKWLNEQGYSPQLINRYRSSGWLSALGRGIVYRAGDELSAFGALVLSLKVCKYSFYSLSFHSFFIFSSFHFLN